MNYEQDIRIDPDSLDVEWLEQPTILMRYAKYYAQCQKAVMQAEEKIKIVRAELIKRANENPDRFLGKGVKPTGPNVEAYYRNHSRHKEAKQEWIDTTFELNVAKDAKDNISFSRKAALENLVTLHGQQYFAGPSVPRDLGKEWEQKQKQRKADVGISDKMNRSKKH